MLVYLVVWTNIFTDVRATLKLAKLIINVYIPSCEVSLISEKVL